MKTVTSLKDRILALVMSVVLVLTMIPASAIAVEPTAEAKIGDVTYDTLAEAIAAVPTGANQTAPEQATTVTLLRDTAYAFDVGNSTGSATMNLKLDLNGNTLTLSPSVGSAGTKSSGIRVLAFSKLEVANGKLVCSSEEADNVKVGIANYGTLTLSDVTFERGSKTLYTVNNRGALTLNGKTTVQSGSTCAITNDPYDLYYTTNVNASVTCSSSEVVVESMLLERYARTSANQGSVELNISAGYFGKIVEDGESSVGTDYNVTGGIIGVSTTEELEFALKLAEAGDAYACPEQPVTIKLLTDLKGSFDVGNSTGTAPKNILLDLNGKTLTLSPSVGSAGTKSNGIRVLAYSKLEVRNGKLVCSSEEADNVKVGIANYSELVLDSVAMEAGALTQYTVNNRGALTLKGSTSVTEGSVCAVTNDPYDLYYTTNVDASVTCDSSEVSVDSILVERYPRNSANKGGVKLNISAGYVGEIAEDNNDSVSADYNITGGSFGSDISDFCSDDYEVVADENGKFVVMGKQTSFGFDKETYTVTFGTNGNEFTAEAKNAVGEVTYSLVAGADVAVLDTKNGKLTIKKAGTVQVKAVAAGDAQNLAAEDTYTLEVLPTYAQVVSFSGGTIEGSGTANVTVTIEEAILEWVKANEARGQDGWWVGIKILLPEGVNVQTVKQQRKTGVDAQTGEETWTDVVFTVDGNNYTEVWGLITAEYLQKFQDEGRNLNYVWQFSWDGDEVFEQRIAISVKPDNIVLKQSGFAFAIETDTTTYGDSYTVKEPSGGQASTVTYKVDDTSVAEIDPETLALKIKKAGTVTITATQSGKYYQDATDSYVLTINKAPQTGFGFDNPPANITWTDEVQGPLALKGCKVENAATWTITAGTDVATVDAKTGKITLLKAGTFTIQAKNGGDDCYLESEAVETTITVGLAKNPVTAADDTLFYGTTEYQSVLNNNKSQGKVTFTIAENEIGASVDANGKVTFVDSVGKVGSVTVTATIAADEKYDEATVSYTLTVNYLPAPNAQCTLSGAKKNDSKWYTGTVTITAPEGYTVSKSNALSADWTASVTYDVEGEDGTETVYLKDKDGHITNAISVDAISLDKNAPTALSITYATPKWAVVLENVTFGLFQNDKLEVTVSADDATSGVASLIYNIGDKDVTVNNNTSDKAFRHTFIINAQYRNKITLKAIDTAGNESELLEDGITVVLDDKNPTREVRYEYATNAHRSENGVLYTQGDTTVVFTIDEANFDLSGLAIVGDEEAKTGVPVVMVGQDVQEVTWTKVENTTKWEAKLTLSGNGDYPVSMTFTDPAGNSMDAYAQEIRIDSGKPVISVSYDSDDYYASSKKAYVEIEDHNFKAEEVKLTVTAKDINGKDVEVNANAYRDYAMDPANWSNDGDVWALNSDGMQFAIDAIYNITLEYTDLAGNEADPYTAEFVIDNKEPNDILYKYDGSVLKLLFNSWFSFKKSDITVTVTARDITSGIAYFDITYTQKDGANTTNRVSYTTEKVAAQQDKNEKDLFTATFVLPADARGSISVKAVDKAGQFVFHQDATILVADSTIPGLTPIYTFKDNQRNEYNGIYYTKNDVKIAFVVDEANFDLSLLTEADENTNAAPVVTVNGVAQDVTWNQNAGKNEWVGEITLSGNGDYVVAMTYTDRAGNEMEAYKQEFHIDNVTPVTAVTYDNNEARNTNQYKASRKATVQITEHNFNAADVVLTVTAKDITGKDVDISAKDYPGNAKNPANWSESNGVWTLDPDVMVFDADAIYSVKLEYTDLAENAADAYTADFTVDKTPADHIKIEYRDTILDKILSAATFGYFQPEVEVIVTAEDMTAGVEHFVLTYTKQEGTSDVNKVTFTTEPLEAKRSGTDKKVFTASYKIPAQARGTVSVAVTDRAGNESSGKNDTVVVIDDKIPTREVLYTPYKILDKATMLEVEAYAEGDNAILYYKDKAVVTFKITEANFDLSLNNDATKPVIKVNGEPVSVTWKQDGDVWTAEHTITGDGDYVVTMTYMDMSTNKMVDYESCPIAIDGTIPVVSVSYDKGEAHQAIGGTKFYGETQTVNVKITDHNFRADDVVLTVTAKDVQGKAVDISEKAYAEYAKDRANWKSEGDVHTLDTKGMVFDTDAIYTFDIAYDDICDNEAVDYAQDSFVVDHVKPTEVKISYSESIIQKIIGAFTYGFYQPKVTVTLTADDVTSGVDFFQWAYTKEEGSSDKNTASYGETITTEDITYTNDGKTATATFTIPADARGYITASATDRAGNKAEDTVDSNRINVVDKIAPTVSVTYTADSEATKVQFLDASKATVDSFEKAVNAFYNGNVTAKIVVDEANFFEGVKAADGVIYQVGVKLTVTDDNGVKTVYEYLPEGAAQKYADAKPVYITWTTTGDIHSFTISYTENADYELEIEYTDLSTNDAAFTANDGKTAAKTYASKVVTVDKVAPVIDVVYGNTDVINTIGGREYLDAVQSAVITVTEHNFRAEDMAAVVTAKNIVGADVAVADFTAQLADKENWEYKGNNVYEAKVEYTVDANYTFDIDFIDLAKNPSADYAPDLFTVDTKDPYNLQVTYSTNVFQEILQSVTFGYYNAMMTVTISAEDDTAGIYHFAYSYIKGQYVSGVNAELLDQAIKEADIAYNGNKATATFKIPKLALGYDNQFNGTVAFTAYDRSERDTELKDTTRIVVDNISPTAKITYNTPVKEANDVSYYDGNIEATIVITEANFRAADVAVTVTKDGQPYKVDTAWHDNSLDVHTGTFTLTEDGDYIVSVRYRDKSGNQMAAYTSNQLTLDTKAPSIKVSNIKQNSANKDAKYGFTIEISDIKLDVSAMKPVLKAVVQGEDDQYKVTVIDLGKAKEVVAGQTYTYTVENLEADALYTLTCEAEDMSDNANTKMLLDDGKSYELVQFSINRNGSTFGYGTAFTEELVNKYYVYSVDEDLVVVEVNVDPIEEYGVTVNGKELTEGTEYTTEQTSSDGQWSKRTYTIKKDLFAAEGEYNVIVSSTDKAETTAFSDVKNLVLRFVVDQTKPVLTITGLDNGGRYQTELQKVTIIPTDEGGRLNSLSVQVLNSDGNPLADDSGNNISNLFNMEGEELLKYLEENDGKILVEIPEGLNNKVRIICNDCAVNAEAETNEYNELFENVTVSPNRLVIFYANKPLFFGTIGGVAAVAAAIIAVLKVKKSKKAKAKV